MSLMLMYGMRAVARVNYEIHSCHSGSVCIVCSCFVLCISSSGDKALEKLTHNTKKQFTRATEEETPKTQKLTIFFLPLSTLSHTIVVVVVDIVVFIIILSNDILEYTTQLQSKGKAKAVYSKFCLFFHSTSANYVVWSMKR